MHKEDCIELLERLGFYCQDVRENRPPVADSYILGRILRHDDGHMPSIYFGGPENGVYITVRLEEWCHFPAYPWDEVDLRPRGYPEIINIVPRPRAERLAIRSLCPAPTPWQGRLGKFCTRLPFYRTEGCNGRKCMGAAGRGRHFGGIVW